MNKHLFSVALLLSTLNACASEQPTASADAKELACAGTAQIGRKRHNAVKPKAADRHWHADNEAIIQNPFAEKDEEGTTGSSTASSGHASPAPQAVNSGFAAAPSSDSATAADDAVVTAAEALAALETSALPETAPKTDAETTLAAAGKRTPSPTAPAGTPADGEIDLDAHDAQDPKTEKVD